MTTDFEVEMEAQYIVAHISLLVSESGAVWDAMEYRMCWLVTSLLHTQCFHRAKADIDARRELGTGAGAQERGHERSRGRRRRPDARHASRAEGSEAGDGCELAS